MNTPFNLLGLEISATLLFLLIFVFILASLILVVVIPLRAVPNADAATLDQRAKLIEMRGKVRQQVLQVIGGITAIAAFIVTIQQIRKSEDDFKQTKANLFSASVAKLMDDAVKVGGRAEAIHTLAFVARSDPSFHRAIFDVLAGHVSDLSNSCEGYTKSSFVVDRQIQIAMRVIGERKVSHDNTQMRLPLERACLVGLDLSDQWGVVQGLTRARLSSAKMLRVDFRRVNLQDAQLMGIEAGDYHNVGWSEEIGRRLHKASDDDDRDDRRPDVQLHERRQFVAHFIEADLTNASLNGAGLQGADFSGATLAGTTFSGANISRASFNGAQGLTAAQLRAACVGRREFSPEQMKWEQPYMWKELGREVEAAGGIPACW